MICCVSVSCLLSSALRCLEDTGVAFSAARLCASCCLIKVSSLVLSPSFCAFIVLTSFASRPFCSAPLFISDLLPPSSPSAEDIFDSFAPVSPSALLRLPIASECSLPALSLPFPTESSFPSASIRFCAASFALRVTVPASVLLASAFEARIPSLLLAAIRSDSAWEPARADSALRAESAESLFAPAASLLFFAIPRPVSLIDAFSPALFAFAAFPS